MTERVTLKSPESVRAAPPMRRTLYAGERGQGLALLREAPFVHVASTDADGAPMLKVVHGVVLEDRWLVFHGAPAGEKTSALGRDAVISASRPVAVVPSYLIDPQRACPATTYYESVQVHGRLEPIEDPDLKAAALQALMERHQPEGGHVPITASDPLYRAAVRGLLVVRVALDQLSCKLKLGQNRKPHQLAQVLAGLWRRGLEGDPRAIDRLVEANPAPEALPDFLLGPSGARLRCHLHHEAHLEAAGRLLEGAYWNVGVSAAQIARAFAGSSARVGAVDSAGELVGAARAVSDDAKRAWIYDVMVAPEWRVRGLGRALMGLLLDHPRVRGVRSVLLSTRDADPFYEKLGFVKVLERDRGGWRSVMMEKGSREAALRR